MPSSTCPLPQVSPPSLPCAELLWLPQTYLGPPDAQRTRHMQTVAYWQTQSSLFAVPVSSASQCIPEMDGGCTVRTYVPVGMCYRGPRLAALLILHPTAGGGVLFLCLLFLPLDEIFMLSLVQRKPVSWIRIQAMHRDQLPSPLAI